MDEAFKNIASLGYSLQEAAIMTSLAPAKSLGIERLGDIEVGYSADIAILDKDFRVVKTIVSGEIVYEK